MLAVVGTALGGCSTREPGNPSAGPNSTASTGSPTTVSSLTASSAGASASLANYKPCDELTAVAGQLPLTEIEKEGTTGCGARYGTTVSLGVKAFLDIGLKDVSGGANATFSDTNIGSRKAKLVKRAFSDSACAVAIEVSATSRVDVVASANTSLDEACDAATKIATAIEPKLPK